jgi:hypothetical protein
MLSEKVIQYALREFEVAIRQMSATRAPAHTFRLSDTPAVSLVLLIVPSEVSDALLDQMDQAIQRAFTGGPVS